MSRLVVAVDDRRCKVRSCWWPLNEVDRMRQVLSLVLTLVIRCCHALFGVCCVSSPAALGGMAVLGRGLVLFGNRVWRITRCAGTGLVLLLSVSGVLSTLALGGFSSFTSIGGWGALFVFGLYRDCYRNVLRDAGFKGAVGTGRDSVQPASTHLSTSLHMSRMHLLVVELLRVSDVSNTMQCLAWQISKRRRQRTWTHAQPTSLHIAASGLQTLLAAAS